MARIATIATIILMQSGITPKFGTASQYAPNVMERVVANRQSWGQLPTDLSGVDGCIAVLSCDDVGQVWLVKPDGGKWEQFLVADCAGDTETIEWMQVNNILVEVDHDTAIRWDTVGKGIKVQVLTEDSVKEKMYRRHYEPLQSLWTGYDR